MTASVRICHSSYQQARVEKVIGYAVLGLRMFVYACAKLCLYVFCVCVYAGACLRMYCIYINAFKNMLLNRPMSMRMRIYIGLQ